MQVYRDGSENVDRGEFYMVSVLKTMRLDEVTITKGPRRCNQCSFGSSGLSCDWRWPDDHPVWVMSQNDGYGPPWYLYPNKGRLNEDGRKTILDYFGLNFEGVADKLPLEEIREMSPARLIAVRRRLEEEFNLPRLDVRCQRVGGEHYSAEEVD